MAQLARWSVHLHSHKPTEVEHILLKDIHVPGLVCPQSTQTKTSSKKGSLQNQNYQVPANLTHVLFIGAPDEWCYHQIQQMELHLLPKKQYLQKQEWRKARILLEPEYKEY